MNIAGLRSIGSVLLLVLLAGAGCNRPKEASSESSPAPTPQGVRPNITAYAPDAFYDPPPDLPRQPGALLRREPLKDVILPAGMRGWRILYATTVNDSTPATAVATVFAPTHPHAGPCPVIAWEHATTGLLQKCMPSAARQMSELTLDKRMVVWGYSQGGHAALWTGIVGPRYAPDLEILGVAAIAPAANIQKTLAMNVEADKRFGPYLALSYSRFYPDITFEQALRPEAVDAARQIVNLCCFLPPEDAERVQALAATFDGPALATNSNKALQARLEQNTADGLITAPVVIAQGLSDNVVPPSATDAYVEERCSTDQRLEYWTFAGRDHFTIVQPGTPLEELLIKWTTARFADEPQPSGCVHKSF